MEDKSINIPSKIITEHNNFKCEYKLVKVTSLITSSKDKPETILKLEETNNEEKLFEELLSTYFVLDESSRCTNYAISYFLVSNARNPVVSAIGFRKTNIQYCKRYRAFLKYIASLEGVKEVKFRDKGSLVRGFSGIKLK